MLINDESSVFAVSDYLGGAGYEGASYGREWERVGSIRRRARHLLRRIGDTGSNLRHFDYPDALAEVRRVHAGPRVLVVGSGGVRYGDDDDEVIHTDVAFAPHVQVIADAHDLPFPDRDYDLVIATAVLEHVADPQRCVGEFWRVLKSDGCVFAVTPFLQPVHMGAYDFTRFTPLGHRRLFRHFDELRWGVAMGVGSTFGWALSAILESISGRRVWRRFARLAGLLLRAPLRKLDRWLIAPAHWDAAAGSFFFGRKRVDPIPDRILIRSYKGGFAPPSGGGPAPENGPAPSDRGML
ncbi:MAG: class I SAM-dependent methyltransferase [Stellaceae bacterium]